MSATKTDQEKLDSWMSLCIEQREEIARMRKVLEEILEAYQANGSWCDGMDRMKAIIDRELEDTHE